MKATLLLVAIMAAPAIAGDTWVNFIRQNQVKSGVVWHMPVDAQGEAASPLALEEDGALFQLWTIRQEDQKDYLLDQQVVGTYLPSAEIRIQTGDPYPHVHRTRADQPFTVEIEIGGLIGGTGVPEAATRVLAEHHLSTYSSGQTSVDPRIATGGTPSNSGYISQNGVISLKFPASSLPAGDPTQAMGEEHFVVHSLPDQDAPQTQIASNFIQVWPVASGSISGIETGDVVRFDAPPLQLHLDNLYPSSTTYLQIYPGAPRLGVDGERVDGTVLVLDQDTKEDRIIALSDWGDAIDEEGQYTMELVTETPFGPERLTNVTFTVDRVLAVNAQMGNFESED
ncbi:hypothetical protein [Haloferula sp.]|uniref:hypothetical protein n=1 Tax=Haloferula sp. TaxID=2497595 RepID=UPI0032A05578